MKLIKTKTGNYSVKYKTASGRSNTLSLKTSNKKKAMMLIKEAKIEELETAAQIKALQRDAITTIIADTNLSFQDCIREWYLFSEMKSMSKNTIYTQSGLLSNFGKLYNINKMSSLSAKDISSWVNDNSKVNANSRTQRLSAMKSLCSYALANGYITKDPSYGVCVDMSKLEHEQKETRERIPFTQKEYDLLKSMDPPYFMHQAITLGWWTGLRIIDISKLEWASWSPTHLTVWTEKQDKRVQLPLDNPLIGGGELTSMMSTILPEDKKYCFPEWAALADDPKRRSRFSVYFNRFLKRAARVHNLTELTGKSFHCFRHSFVSRTNLSYDASLEKIADWVGHSNTKTTEIYLHK